LDIRELEEHHPGDNAALVLGHIYPVVVQKGMVLAETGSIKPHRKFIAQLYVLRQDEGAKLRAS
jgi:elongation factor Tu